MSSTSNVASDRVRLGRLSEPVMTPLGFKGLDIRSRPLTFQLRVVALWPLVDPIKKTERQDEVFARLLVGREVLLPPIISYGSPNTKGPSARARASYPGGKCCPSPRMGQHDKSLSLI